MTPPAVAVISGAAGGEEEELEAALHLRLPFLCSVKKICLFYEPSWENVLTQRTKWFGLILFE